MWGQRRRVNGSMVFGGQTETRFTFRVIDGAGDAGLRGDGPCGEACRDSRPSRVHVGTPPPSVSSRLLRRGLLARAISDRGDDGKSADVLYLAQPRLDSKSAVRRERERQLPLRRGPTRCSVERTRVPRPTGRPGRGIGAEMAYNYVVTVRTLTAGDPHDALEPRPPRSSRGDRAPALTHIQQNDEPYWRCADPRSDRSRPPPRLPQAQKPTSVTHSLVGNFTHDNELNLIVA